MKFYIIYVGWYESTVNLLEYLTSPIDEEEFDEDDIVEANSAKEALVSKGEDSIAIFNEHYAISCDGRSHEGYICMSEKMINCLKGIGTIEEEE